MAESHIVTFHKCGSNWFRRVFREAARRNRQNIWVARPNSVSISQPVDIGAADTMCLYRTVGFDAVQDRGDHYRKGIAGDWKNYSSGPLAQAFNTAYGRASAALGYDLA